MAQYLVAQWDYSAEGNYELSFKEGDQIKLLEKHNEDWWEGELNDEIGFFPANRTMVMMEPESKYLAKKTAPATAPAAAAAVVTNINSDQIPPPSNSNPYVKKPQLPERPKDDLLVDISTDPTLPDGWSSSFGRYTCSSFDFYFTDSFTTDQTGTIYFFNQSTGESQWEKPVIIEEPKDITTTELVYDIQKLNLDALHPNWIRIQSSVQMKIVTEEEIPWREYYVVLAVGYLLIYKEGLSKSTRRPTSIKPVAAYGTVNIVSSEIIPATTKLETRKKNAFIIKDKNLKLIISVANETLYSDWLDAIMRESIAIKENKETQDMDLVQLLGSIPLQNRLIKQEPTSEDSKSSLTRWFSRSSRSSGTKLVESPVTLKEVFGGNLQLEDGEIPFVVRACIEQVDKRGLDVVGIYRLSGQTTSIQKYKTLFNTNPEQVNLSEENDINVITGLLKLYFRELKTPLFTYEYYDRVIEAARLQDYDERMFRLKSIVQVLPIAHYKVLHYLVKHLERVKDQSDINKMEPSNLALIFSVGLLRSKQDDLSCSILHTDMLSKAIEIMIRHVDWFFDDKTVF
ncbi:Rho GTPase activation protein [Pilaira anomala]|nr:Rho GTPase activation protein [Pilaira anomala]